MEQLAQMARKVRSCVDGDSEPIHVKHVVNTLGLFRDLKLAYSCVAYETEVDDDWRTRDAGAVKFMVHLSPLRIQAQLKKHFVDPTPFDLH